MLLITLRDLQFRARQFGIAVIGAALVFALTLILTGISGGFRRETETTTRGVAADAWIVPHGVEGPFTSASSMPTGIAATVTREAGALQAEPLVVGTQLASVGGGKTVRVTVMGHHIGALGDPVWDRGHFRGHHGEAVADSRLGVGAGSDVTVAGRRLRIVRVVHERTLFGGTPTLYVGLRDAQRLVFDDRRLCNVVLVKGHATRLPPGFDARSNRQIRADMLKPLNGAITVIDTLRLLMWIVAAVIIGAVSYLSAIERARDFAVLKAVGAGARMLAASLAAQAVITSFLAAVIGAMLTVVLKPAFPVPVVLPNSTWFVMPSVALLVGLVASAAALRRAVRVDPALAFT